MTTENVAPYAARLEIDYPDRDLDRVSTLLRILYVIPIAIVVGALSSATAGGILVFPTMMMIVFRQKYPRWWFDFHLQLSRLTMRVSAYATMMSDEYPSTTDEQYVHLDLDYPDATKLNRWAPLWKWFLAIPHYIVLAVLALAAFVALIVVWFAILFTGRYPAGIFEFVAGVMRWALRVEAYAFLLITDEYPPFSLD
jgi:hypothetical protein